MVFVLQAAIGDEVHRPTTTTTFFLPVVMSYVALARGWKTRRKEKQKKKKKDQWILSLISLPVQECLHSSPNFYLFIYFPFSSRQGTIDLPLRLLVRPCESKNLLLESSSHAFGDVLVFPLSLQALHEIVKRRNKKQSKANKQVIKPWLPVAAPASRPYPPPPLPSKPSPRPPNPLRSQRRSPSRRRAKARRKPQQEAA